MTAHASIQPPRAPVHIEEALELLSQPGWLPLAGGTDVFPAHVGRPIAQPLLDLSRIDGLRGQGRVTDAAGRAWWRIGALETWSAVRDAPLPPGFEALVQAALEVGGRQIQNQGTLGATSATLRQPPTACRYCSRSMPRWNSGAGRAADVCRLKRSCSVTVALRSRPGNCWWRSTCLWAARVRALSSSSSDTAVIW